MGKIYTGLDLLADLQSLPLDYLDFPVHVEREDDYRQAGALLVEFYPNGKSVIYIDYARDEES